MIEGVDQLLECMLVTSEFAINGQVPTTRGPDDEDDDEDDDEEEEEDEIREPRRGLSSRYTRFRSCILRNRNIGR
jgi:hypothetical protein